MTTNIKKTSKKINFKLALVALFAIAIILTQKPFKVNAASQTFTVTNTNSSGLGSLSQAVEDANSNNNPLETDVIEFNINGAMETHYIEPSTQIVIEEPVLVNGFTQAGSSQNTTSWPYPMDSIVRIEISLLSTESLLVESPNVELRGLAINLGTGTALDLTDADNFKLAGSYLHTDYTGLRGMRENNSPPPGIDYSLEVVSIKGSDGVDLGGSTPAERNIIGGCTNFCILAEANGATPTTNLNIEGNYITVGADWFTSVAHNDQGRGIGLKEGTTDVTIHKNSLERVYFDPLYISDSDYVSFTGNRVLTTGSNTFGDGPIGYSVAVLGSKHITIGSSDPDGRNLFGGLKNGGIVVTDSASNRTSEDVVIENNSFGYAGDDSTPFPGRGNSISVGGSSEFINIKGNKIHNTTGGNDRGVNIEALANEVSIVGNSIYNNSSIGIDLGGFGPDFNDSLDTDTGANDALNYPEWYQVAESGGDTVVDFTADLPAGDYRIEFFSNTVADPSGNGEGEVFLGYSNITSTGSPNNFSNTLTGITGVTNLSLTATEIDGSSPSGFGATSEFGGEGTMHLLPKDLSIEKSLDNPENYYPGNTVQYTVTLTNSGVNPIDLTTLDGSGNPLFSSLFSDFLAPGMTFNSVVSGDVLCGTLGTFGSVDPGNPMWANHQDYQVTPCAYIGADTSFEPNESISITISVDLALDFDLGLANTVVPGLVEGDSGEAVTGACMEVAFAPGSTTDIIECLLEDNSGNADIAQNEVPHADLSITKTLNNPENFVQNGQVAYNVTISNDGTGSLDLGIFDGSGFNPLASSIIFDFVPPDMTYISSSNNDVSCSILIPQLGLAGTTFSNHSEYAGLSCIYIGSADLGPAEEISTDLTFQLSGDSNLSYTNYAASGWAPYDPGNSIAGGCLTSANQPEATQDGIDCLVADASGDADIAQAGAPTDVDISQVFSAPNGVSPGSTVSYTYTFTNNGPGDVSLPWYRSATPMFANIFPAGDLTFTGSSSSTPGVGCLDIGPGSAIFLGTIAQDHTSHNLVICGYTGTDNLTLASGESITININATINQGSDGQFTNYLTHASTLSDPDSNSMYQLLFNATEDQLDTIEDNPMFSRLSYPEGSNPDSDGGGIGGGGNSDGLSGTGDSIKVLIILGLVLSSAAVLSAIVLRKKSSKKQNM